DDCAGAVEEDLTEDDCAGAVDEDLTEDDDAGAVDEDLAEEDDEAASSELLFSDAVSFEESTSEEILESPITGSTGVEQPAVKTAAAITTDIIFKTKYLLCNIIFLPPNAALCQTSA
ncbi:MAG: hypothetical protein J1F03_09215, partial [Oscillospiraceae bacterium]|nr:hypothetical protein [Oscillospiraceae bacterium]